MIRINVSGKMYEFYSWEERAEGTKVSLYNLKNIFVVRDPIVIVVLTGKAEIIREDNASITVDPTSILYMQNGINGLNVRAEGYGGMMKGNVLMKKLGARLSGWKIMKL